MQIKIGRVMWPGVVGIGAGLVKNGAMLLEYGKVASSVEIGSITRHMQLGNPGRTVWKVPQAQSLRHNAGMPNNGVEHLAADLIRVQDQMTVPWGVNVAVSPGITNSQEAALDIRETVHLLLVGGVSPDWLTLNVASPDTEDRVEMLSEPERVKVLINEVQKELAQPGIPLWLKVGPGMTNDRLQALAELCVTSGIECLICGNTLPDTAGGGWGGRLMGSQANAALWWLKLVVGERLHLVGTGGVMTGKDARRKLNLGASLVQVVSALLIRGREAASVIQSELERL